MSIKVEYSGQVYLKLGEYFAIKDGFSIGEKLTQLEKESGEKLYNLSDEDLYNILSVLVKTQDYHKDEVFSDKEFKNWVKDVTTTK